MALWLMCAGDMCCACWCSCPQVSQLLLLDNQDASKDIKMFINSPGACNTA